MEEKICQMHRQDSQDLLYQRKGRQNDAHGPGGETHKEIDNLSS